MASVFALILVPAVFATGALLLSLGGGSMATVLGGAMFVVLAAGVFRGLFGLAQKWEEA